MREDDYDARKRGTPPRDRYPSPDRGVGRDRWDSARERDYRPRRDDSRERHKRRRDDSIESRPKRRREDDRNGTESRATDDRKREVSLDTSGVSEDRHTDRIQPPRSAVSKQPQTEEEKKAERLAKLEAWKQKQLADRARKGLDNASTVKPFSLSEMDEKYPTSPSVATPDTPRSPLVSVGKADITDVSKKIGNAARSSPGLSKNINASATLSSVSKEVKANSTKAPLLQSSNRESSFPRKRRHANDVAFSVTSSITAAHVTNVRGFGLGQKPKDEADKGSAKPGLDLGEAEETRIRLERLPTPPLGTLTESDAATANADQDLDAEDEDTDMVDADNEEDAAAAARAAAEKREKRILAQSEELNSSLPIGGGTSEQNTDVSMIDAPSASEVAPPGDDEDAVDPLDSFMANLTETQAPGISGAKTKSKQQEPKPMFENEDNELDAMDVMGEDIMDLPNKAQKKKDIPTVDHSTMKYDVFRKDFYAEPSELANLSEPEVADLRLELDGIKVRGVDVPKPVVKWSQCGLGVLSLEVINKMGFEKPSAIQSQALPAIMSGRDVIGIAKTGSGKTIAFLLPMFRHIKDQKPLETLDGPIGLIMTPTRELATQIHKECRPWLKALNLRAVCAYGGAPIKDQIAQLKRGAEIVVCTPGRMIDLLAANHGRVTNLRRVTYTVLDEADRMFDMGFEPQVMKIMANIRPQRQTVLFSATFPRNMEALARKTLSKPVEIVVGGRSVVAPEITQLVEVRPENSKFLRLLQLLGEIHQDEDARSLIFVDRQESAEELMNAIMRKGYPCFAIHGGKDQYDRDSVISDFKAGVFPVLVATSVAARGLDVKQLKMVVNFDCPNHLEDYVHRAGRTGRAGNTGLAVTFITPEQERYSVDVKKALTQSKQEVPADLQKLVDAFMEKVKAGKEKASGLGFGGKGLDRLDQERDATKARERKSYRTANGEEEAEEEKEKEKVEELKLEKSVEVIGKAGTTTTESNVTNGEATGLEALDGKVKVHKREATAATAADKTQKVNDAVAAINARLRKGGELRGNAPIDNKGPDAGAFHSTFEINDLPQKARWAVTNRTNVAKILESTGTSITTKGNFYAAGTTPSSTDPPKLYILVEGDTEVVVTQAVSELRRLAKEGMMAAITSDARAPASGRYSVV